MVHGFAPVALAAALVLAPGARAQIDQWPWHLDGGASGGNDWILLELSPSEWTAEATVFAPDQGTLTFDLVYTLAVYPPASFFLINSDDILVTAGSSFPGVCPSVPCKTTITGISTHLDEGEVFHAFLGTDPFAAWPATSTLLLRHLTFTPDVGFVDAGHELTGGVLAQFPPESPVYQSVDFLVAMDDVDQDGHADILVGSQPGTFGGLIGAGRVDLVSGQTLLPLWTYFGPVESAAAGQYIDRLGDANGDGVGDVVIGLADVLPGTTQDGTVQLRSGVDGALLLEVPPIAGMGFGQGVAGPGDIDGDSVPDFAVGLPYASTGAPLGGAMELRSGANGGVILSYAGTVPQAELGRRLAGAGDVDADGVPDIVIGLDSADQVLVLSGATGTPLHQWFGDQPGDHFGWSVDGAGDANGDGFADVVANAFYGGPLGIGSYWTGDGYVRVLSGADGAVLFEDDNTYHTWGYGVAGVGDLDGDGMDDVLVGGSKYDTGHAIALGGPDGHTILDVAEAFGFDTAFGKTVSGGFDVDGDSVPDLLAGGTSALVLSGLPLDHVAPHVAGSGDLLPGTPISLSITEGLPQGLASLVVGLTDALLPFKGGVLVPNPDLLIGPLLLDAQGGLVLAGTWPAGVPSDSETWIQVWALDPKGPHGWTASNALQLITP